MMRQAWHQRPTSLPCNSPIWEERAAVQKQLIAQRGDLSTDSECRGHSWCLMFPVRGSRGKRIFENGGDFVLKVTIEMDHEFQEESQKMRTLCARAQQRSFAGRLPWTGELFRLDIDNGTAASAMLQQRIEGRMVNGSPVHFAEVMHELSWAAAMTSARDAARLARLLDCDLATDLQFMRTPDGALWFFDPGRLVHPPSGSSHGCIARELTFAPGALVRPHRGSACSDPDVAHHVYSLHRQRAKFASYMLAAALYAANRTDALDEAMCRAAACDLGCAVINLPARARAALAPLGPLGAQVLAMYESLAASGLSLDAVSAQGTALQSAAACSPCALFETGFACIPYMPASFGYESPLLCEVGGLGCSHPRCEATPGCPERLAAVRARVDVPKLQLRVQRLAQAEQGSRVRHRGSAAAAEVLEAVSPPQLLLAEGSSCGVGEPRAGGKGSASRPAATAHHPPPPSSPPASPPPPPRAHAGEHSDERAVNGAGKPRGKPSSTRDVQYPVHPHPAVWHHEGGGPVPTMRARLAAFMQAEMGFTSEFAHSTAVHTLSLALDHRATAFQPSFRAAHLGNVSDRLS